MQAVSATRQADVDDDQTNDISIRLGCAPNVEVGMSASRDGHGLPSIVHFIHITSKATEAAHFSVADVCLVSSLS